MVRNLSMDAIFNFNRYPKISKQKPLKAFFQNVIFIFVSFSD